MGMEPAHHHPPRATHGAYRRLRSSHAPDRGCAGCGRYATWSDGAQPDDFAAGGADRIQRDLPPAGDPVPDRHRLRLDRKTAVRRQGLQRRSRRTLTSQASAAASASARRSTAITSRPLYWPDFGALALGTIARLKPCVAASRKRSSPLGTGRISPDNPTSPNAMVLSASGLSRRDDRTASSTGRSAAVSCSRMPPTTLTNTSWSPTPTPP